MKIEATSIFQQYRLPNLAVSYITMDNIPICYIPDGVDSAQMIINALQAEQARQYTRNIP